MATINGEAGRRAATIALAKQRSMFAKVLTASLLGVALLCFLAGWGIARQGPMAWLVLLVLFVLVGGIVILDKKFNRLIDREMWEARVWRRGADGERMVGEMLKTELPDTYCVFNDVCFPGRKANIDHLVVGPSGVFVLNTKNWRGMVGWSEDGKTLLWNGAPDTKNTINSALAEAMKVREIIHTLVNRDVYVKAVLVFPLAKVFPRLNMSVDLQQDDYLIEKRLKYIDKRTALAEKDVQEIKQALLALFRKSI